MTRPARVGLVGCGVISSHYAQNAEAFESFELVACGDVDPARADELSSLTGIPVAAPAEIVADPGVDVVLNLTPPAAHAALTRDALAAGKHVYTEKPLAPAADEAAALVAEADGLGLRIGCAPDIFLGAPYQTARALIDEGAIGEPISVSATMLAGTQESWHPNPDIFFADGAGPLLDMGPYYLTAMVALLGPIRRVAGFASTRTHERTIEVGPRAGTRFPVETPAHTSAVLELEGGVTATLVASFEVRDQYVCDFQVHGTEGRLALPDPNAFAGPVRVVRGRGEWQDVPLPPRSERDARGLGLDDLVESIAAGAPHRASGQLGAHVVEVARAILRAAELQATITIESRPGRPDPLPRLGRGLPGPQPGQDS